MSLVCTKCLFCYCSQSSLYLSVRSTFSPKGRVLPLCSPAQISAIALLRTCTFIPTYLQILCSQQTALYKGVLKILLIILEIKALYITLCLHENVKSYCRISFSYKEMISVLSHTHSEVIRIRMVKLHLARRKKTHNIGQMK